MSAQSSSFQHNVPRTVAGIAAILIAFACEDSTAPQVPAKYLITASPSSPVAGSQVLLRAQLVDADDTPIAMAGRSIIWFDGETGVDGFNPYSTFTVSDGSATTMFTTTTVAGVVHRISVRDNTNIIGNADITTVAGPATAYTVTPSTFQPVVGSEVLISAQLTDANRNASKTAGRVVNWSSNGGGSFSSPTSTTNSDGIATVTFTVGSAVGGYNVHALDNQFTAGTSPPFISVAGPVAKYILSASVADPPAGADIIIYAQASDANGNVARAQGRLVTWTKTGPGGSLASAATRTDENGTATVTFTTSSVAGSTYAISGSDAGGFSGTSPNITTQSQVSLASIATGVGAMSSCGIATDGKPWCWGANDLGGLGNGTTVDRSLPGKVSGDLTMTSLSAGLSHACGVTTGGVVQCWGGNFYGELGDNTFTSRSVPSPIVSPLTFIAVTAGAAHTCALTGGGDVYCWGSNFNGRLGDGGLTTTAKQPVKVVGSHSFASISAGGAHTCGVTTGGDAYCWGTNGDGQLGNNTATNHSTPTPVAGGFKFTAVSAAESHTCGVVVSGAAYCWGDDSHGELGDGTPLAQRNAPTPVTGGLSFVAISAGGYHTCGIAASSAAWCWGDNGRGELGNSTTSFSASPTAVAGGLLFKSISAGGVAFSDGYYYYYTTIIGHTCGVTTAGVAYCWGANDRGEIGDGPTFLNAFAPRKVGGQP